MTGPKIQANNQDTSWQIQAVCKGSPDFYPPTQLLARDSENPAERVDRIKRAKITCFGCPVRKECLKYAVDNEEHDGIWGGKTPLERAREQKGYRIRDFQASEAKFPLTPCLVCGTMFQPQQSTNLYCRNLCRMNMFNERRRAVRRRNA